LDFQRQQRGYEGIEFQMIKNHESRIFYSELLGLWTSYIVPYSNEHQTQNFRNWICFRPQVKKGEIYTLLLPLERAKLNHWTAYISITTGI
jgi:hypothetical protein